MSSEEEQYDFQLYRYTPSEVAAIHFAVLFGLSALHHSYKLIRTRTWYFIPLTVGCFAEMTGYIARAISHWDKEAIPPFMVQSILLVISPALFCASIYMILSRMVRVLEAEDKCIVSLRWLTKIFVLGDIISFLVQGAGSGVMSDGALKTVRVGEKIVVGGVFFQVLVFSIFLIVTIVLHVRLLKNPTSASHRLSQTPYLKQNWKTLLGCIYAAWALVMARSIFRGVEFLTGNDGPLMRHEGWIYGFDGVLMWFTVLLFNWCHPSGVVPGRRKRGGSRGRRSRKKNKEMEGLSSSEEAGMRLDDREV